MRQFIYETEENEQAENIVVKKKEELDNEAVYRKQKPLKVLNNLPKVRVVNNCFKNASVSNIIE